MALSALRGWEANSFLQAFNVGTMGGRVSNALYNFVSRAATVGNNAAGYVGETIAMRIAAARGEVVIQTQYAQGAASSGKDFVSVVLGRTGNVERVISNEVKNWQKLVKAEDLTAYGLSGKAGAAKNAQKAIDKAVEAVSASSSLTSAQREAVISALEARDVTVRLIGNSATRWDMPGIVEALNNVGYRSVAAPQSWWRGWTGLGR